MLRKKKKLKNKNLFSYCNLEQSKVDNRTMNERQEEKEKDETQHTTRKLAQ